jgi:hypothetical protein
MSVESPKPELPEATENDENDISLPSLNFLDTRLISFEVKCRLECLVHDLRQFKSDPRAMSQVEKANLYPFCFGPPYLSPATGEALLNLILSNNSTLREYLGGMAGRKGYHICTSHTLAPALTEIFNLDEDFEAKSSFKRYYSRFSAAARSCGDGAVLGDLTNSDTPVETLKKSKKSKKQRS